MHRPRLAFVAETNDRKGTLRALGVDACCRATPCSKALLENTPVTRCRHGAFPYAWRGAHAGCRPAQPQRQDAREEALTFYCALARQCFSTNTSFHTEEELGRARVAAREARAALQSGSAVPPRWIAAVAAYFPLHSIPGAERLLRAIVSASHRATCWRSRLPSHSKNRRDAAAIPRLTAIGTGVSDSVRQSIRGEPLSAMGKAAALRSCSD